MRHQYAKNPAPHPNSKHGRLGQMSSRSFGHFIGHFVADFVEIRPFSNEVHDKVRDEVPSNHPWHVSNACSFD